MSPFSLSRAPLLERIYARVPLSSGSVRLKISPSLRRLFAAAAAAVRAPRWFSFSRISRIPTASPYVSFRIIRASRALLSSASAAYSRSPRSLLRPSSSVSDSLSAARFPCNKRRCPLPVSFFSFSSFSPPLLHHHHPPPSFPLVPLAPVRTHTRHTACVCVWLSCDLAIRDTTSTTNERKPTARRSSCSRGEPLLLSRRKDSSTFPTAPGSASILAFLLYNKIGDYATRGSHRGLTLILDLDFRLWRGARRRSALASTQNASRDESTTVSLS